MTLTLTEIALLVMAASVFAGVIAMYTLTRKVGEAAEETRRTMTKLGNLTPRVERGLDELTTEIRELQELTRRTESVVEHADAVGQEVRAGVTALQIAKRSRAAAAGARAGFSALRDLAAAPAPSTNGGSDHDSNQ